MGGRQIRSAGEWRRRLAGRTGFDRAAAEEAIRCAYSIGGLAPPARILWASGPSHAADLLRFLSRPPRIQRRLGIVLLLVGAILWTVLATAAAAPPVPEQRFGAAPVIAPVLAFYLARAGLRSLPAPPTGAQTETARARIWSCVLVILVMVGILIALRRFGPDPDTAAHGLALAAAAAAGMLPGAVLLHRVGRAYRSLPARFDRLSPGRSVARPIARRLGVPGAGPRSGVRPDASLLQCHDSAYSDAFGRPDELLLDAGIVPARSVMQTGMWIPPDPLRRGDPAPFRLVPAHLDGIADAERAATAEQEGSPAGIAFADLAFHVDRVFPFRGLAVAVLPPTMVSLDAEGRPHAEGGPALAWADGTEVHAWRGRVVDADLVDAGAPVTLARIWREREAERRSVLIERYGLGRFLTESEATTVQTDACGALYRLDQPGEPVVAVRVVNGTAEPDGSFREFWLRVPPGMRTAREAVAWTFGLTPEEYDLAAQS